MREMLMGINKRPLLEEEKQFPFLTSSHCNALYCVEISK